MLPERTLTVCDRSSMLRSTLLLPKRGTFIPNIIALTVSNKYLFFLSAILGVYAQDHWWTVHLEIISWENSVDMYSPPESDRQILFFSLIIQFRVRVESLHHMIRWNILDLYRIGTCINQPSESRPDESIKAKQLGAALKQFIALIFLKYK